LRGLLNNQKFYKFSRGTLPNETSHSVFNAKEAGKGLKSYDLCQTTLELLAVRLNAAILAKITNHRGVRYGHGDRGIVALASSLRQSTRELLRRASDPDAEPYTTDYMRAFKGLFPERTTLEQLVARGFSPKALPSAPWTAPEDGVLKGCLKDYAEEPAVVEEWGTLYRWISHAHIRSRDSRAVAARIFELAKRDLGCILPDLPNPEDVPNDTDSEAE